MQMQFGRSKSSKIVFDFYFEDLFSYQNNELKILICISIHFQSKIFKYHFNFSFMPYYHIKIMSQSMLQDNPFSPRTVTCLIHRKQKATHICTEFGCLQTPILCGYCFSDARIRSQHPHESSLKPLPQGVEWLTSVIRTQAKSIELLYERTIGNRQSQLIKFNLQKGSAVGEQLQGRLENLRIQFQVDLQMLSKQFQKQIQLERQQFSRRLEQYKRMFVNNLQVVRRECVELLTYQHSLRYYNNSNTFTLKLINQSQKRSQDWFLMQKKVLLRISQALQNPAFSTNLALLLNRVNKSNLLMMPAWKGDKRDGQIEKDLHHLIKTAINSWIQLPELMDLEQVKPTDFPSPSNKFIMYPLSL